MRSFAQISGLLARTSMRAFNVLRVENPVKDAEIVTFGNRVFECDTHSVSNITAGRIRVDCSELADPAVQTLTLSGNAVADETVTIGARVYTWKAALSGSNQVLIGESASESLDNLIAAINGAAGAGTTYGAATTAHADVTAAAGAGGTMDITHKTPGTAGNAVDTTETMTNGSWGAETMEGGTDVEESDFISALAAAADPLNDIGVYGHSTTELIMYVQDQIGPVALPCSETLSGANNGWSSATTYGGKFPQEELKVPVMISRVPTATEVALETMHFYFGFNPSYVMVQIRDSGGAIKAFDGGFQITGSKVSIESSGTEDIAADDVVTVIAQ